MNAQAMKTRRTFLRSGCLHCLGTGALLTLRDAVAQTADTSSGLPPQVDPLPSRFARPSLESDEGGLWAMMDREEQRLRRSSFVVRDEKLQKYLQALVCKLGGTHCADSRVHVVRTPRFNASMAPNGMMQIWTGLLLRVENEAQLAAVVGHELGHYLERHTLQQMRDLKDRAALAQFVGVFGVVGLLAQIGVAASVFSFSREQESRADRLGFQLLTRAGYDGRQAASVWDNLLGELQITGGEDAGKRSPLFATHPPVANRRDALIAMAGDRAGELGIETLKEAIAPHRAGWMQDELRRGQYDESLVLFNRMLLRDPDDLPALFARAEAHRLRAGVEDDARAFEDLSRLAAMPEPPAAALRAIGLIHKQRGNGTSAAHAFERYLAVAPEAADANLIKSYLLEIKP